MQCYEKIKENMEEFWTAAEALNKKISDSVLTDIDAALKAINFPDKSSENDEIAQDLYSKARNKTQDLYYNEQNFIKKDNERFEFIEIFRKSNKIYIENNVLIKEHIKIEEDFELYLQSEKDVFFTYLSAVLQTSLEFIFQKEILLINSYNNRYKKAAAPSIKTPDHNQDTSESTNELEELLEKIAIAQKDSQILNARAEYARMLLHSEEMLLQEQDAKHKIILTKKQIATQKKNNAIERKEIQEINAQTRMIKAQTFAIKAKDEAAKLVMERAKVDICRAKASIAQTRVKAQEQKTIAAQARAQEMNAKLEQTRALEAFIKSKIQMKGLQESIKEARKIRVIGGVVQAGDSAGEVAVAQ